MQATTYRAYVSGTLALDLSGNPPQAEALRQALTLTQTNPDEGESPYVPFYTEANGWLEIPRGFLLTSPQAPALLAGFTIEEGRSGGYALPPGTKIGATLGAPPNPPDQPAFVDAIVRGCLANGHGGLAEAPTRAGKTLCSLEAAARLGGSTLILVDRGALLNQWVTEIEKKTTGLGLPCGIIREDRFDLPPQFSFVVGMVQTLSKRALPDEFRKAFRTVIVDECNNAPTRTALLALGRVAASYVIGLTATPDRKDGLGDAIGWLIGPPIARLHRDLNADVHFMHIPFAHAKVERQEEGQPVKLVRPRVNRPNGMVNIVGVEQSLCADEERINALATEAMKAKNDGRRVLIFVSLREHVFKLSAAIKAQGYAPGIFIGGRDDVAAMQRDICLTTFAMSSKGIDFQPPFTLVMLAAPRADIRQAMGRVLNPNAPCRALILDVVDEHESLIGLALARSRYYADKRFTFRNDVRRNP